jgi:alpha-L-arabinofuranosidase
MRSCLIVIFLSLTLTCPTTSTSAEDLRAADNLLSNPSFDIVSDGVPEGWEFRSWGNTQRFAQWQVAAAGRSGRCVTISSHDSNGTDSAWTARITVKPNTFYRLSGWIKTKGIAGATGALLNIQNMQSVRTPPVQGTSDWIQVSTVFRTAAEPLVLEINCLFGGWGTSTGQAWYDDIAVEPIDMDDSTTATVTIDSNAEAKPYSPMILGGFIEHFNRQIYGGLYEPGSPLADKKGFRKDVIEAMKELKLSVVRWPGGCFVSGYDWEGGVGRNRKPVDDMAWGVVEPNTFGTDEFVEWCRLVGCTPYICTNAGDGTPEEMGEWVEYCNQTEGPYAEMRREGGHVKPLNVPIWSVGNENWGSHEIGQKTVEEWGPLVRRSAQIMKAADPSVILTAAATPNRSWTLPLLEAAGEYLDYVSVHGYWLHLWTKNEMPDYMTCIMRSEEPEHAILATIGVLEESGHRGRIKIAFDEWNLRAWHHPGFPRKEVADYGDPEVIELVKARDKNLIASQYTMADALFTASFLNACLRHADDVGMANIAPIVNTRGPLHVHPEGIVRRTTFHALAMYANLLGNRVVTADIEAGQLVHDDRFIPVVDGIATIDDAGKTWSIALVNRHPSQEVCCTLVLGGDQVTGTFDATVLAGPSTDAYNDTEYPNRVVPRERQLTFRQGKVDLPAHSLTIVRTPAIR